MNVKSDDLKNTLADPDDTPELDDGFFERADVSESDKVLRRGRLVSANKKTHISTRSSPEVVEAFKASGSGWLTRMNATLKA